MRLCLVTICIRSVINCLFQVCLGRERFGGFGCYDIIEPPGGAPWHEAFAHCVEMGRALLAIESKAENDAVEDSLLQIAGNYIHDFIVSLLMPWYMLWRNYNANDKLLEICIHTNLSQKFQPWLFQWKVQHAMPAKCYFLYSLHWEVSVLEFVVRIILWHFLHS